MTGLQKVCKLYGRIDVVDSSGHKVVWLWDYKNDKPRLRSEMTADEIAESEKAKFQYIKHHKWQ